MIAACADLLNANNRCTNIGPHITNAVNIAGCASEGSHSALGSTYAFPPWPGGLLSVQWQGASAWWIIETSESFNGLPKEGQGDFWMWFWSGAWGGTNYSNTPVGAVTHTDEPMSMANTPSIYFPSWAAGLNLGQCAWCSWAGQRVLQVVADPLVKR